MVEGYCIYGGWMLAAAMDLVFAAEDAQFLGGVVEYMSFPWDIGMRQAKELCFESRFISAAEAHGYGFVNRVVAPADLERETLAYARRVAENSALHLQLAKQMVNRAQDGQGFLIPALEIKSFSDSELCQVVVRVGGNRLLCFLERLVQRTNVSIDQRELAACLI